MTKPEKQFISYLLIAFVFAYSLLIISDKFSLLDKEIDNLIPTQAIIQSHQNGVIITPQMARILNCIALAESGGNQRAIGQDGEIGIFQYKILTWLFFNKKYNLNLDIKNPVNQVIMTAIALRDNKHSHWTTIKYCK